MYDEKSKLRALSEIASIDITLEFNKILENILKLTCDTMNAHSGTMMLVDEPTGELRMVASFGLVSIGDILSKSAQDVELQAKYKDITMIQDVKPLPRIWGDEEKLTQVITNLLSNAIKFTPQKGTVTIAATENTKGVKVSITDTGIGIPPDKLSRIFERFYQIDGSPSRKYGGAGLGLSICKSIIESHYGSIWAKSDGSGSTFHIVLPKLADIKKTRS